MAVSDMHGQALPAVDRLLARAVAPLHKRALGLAVGVTTGAGMFLLTAFHIVLAPGGADSVELLAQYFYGYRVTWPGAFIGAWWGLVSGFVAGWFLAFSRNAAVATWLRSVRARAEFARTRDFLDHF